MREGDRLMAYECFHCGERAVIWCGDFDFEDYMLEGEGVVHECYCTNCGASITYEVPTPNWGEDDDDD
jgi:transcription elongation factor Elf1